MTRRILVYVVLAACLVGADGVDGEPAQLRHGSTPPDWHLDIEPAIIPAADVRDPVLAYLVGLLDEDVLDTLSGADIRGASVRSEHSTLIPLHLLEHMGRGCEAVNPQRVITFWLSRDGKVPAPYSLLGYHPGSVLIPKRVVLQEWNLGRVVITDRTRGALGLDNCYLWAVREGSVSIDIDGFIDSLLGGAVDDMHVTSLALFTLDGIRYAMAMGYNEKGQGRSGALNLAKNELEFPSSWKLKAAGKLLRRKAEALSGDRPIPQG